MNDTILHSGGESFADSVGPTPTASIAAAALVESAANAEVIDAREADDAVAADTADRQPIKLHKPVRLKGKLIEELVLDFGVLSMKDFENIDTEMTTSGVAAARNVMLSTAYVLRIAARAAGTNIDEFSNAGFHAKDVNRIIQVAQNFLMA